MNLRDISLLYNYSYWAIGRILAASVRVNTEEFVISTTHSFGSLRGTLVHTLDSEYAWRMLLQHHTLEYFHAMKEEDYPTVDSLAQRWKEEEQSMRDYLASLTDDDLDSYVRYTTPEGEKRERVLWHCLVHIVNHGTHHRSEAAAILTDYDSSPGGLDFTAFLNEQPKSL